MTNQDNNFTDLQCHSESLISENRPTTIKTNFAVFLQEIRNKSDQRQTFGGRVKLISTISLKI